MRNGIASQALLSATVDALAGTLGLRDGGTGTHSDRVAELACRLGRRLGLDPHALRDLRHAGRLHDIGKVGVPDAILLKPRPLTGAEWELVRRHSEWGEELLRRIPGLERVALIVRHHHERFDGAGYPDGLAGTQIPLESRILTAADAYLAMMEPRPYRPPVPPELAERRLGADMAGHFDPDVVAALRAELSEGATLEPLAALV